MLGRPIHLLAALVLAWAALLSAAETPVPEAPTQWVTDTANFLSPATVDSLNTRLAQYQQTTGHQVIVYIAPTTGGAPIEDWAVRAFAKWKVGRRGLDDGLAIFIMTQDHRVRIEVGYGLEATVPDAIASRVINEVMVPRIQAGRNDEAVTAALDTLTGVIGGQAGALTPASPAAPPAPSAPPGPAARFLRIVFWILLVGFLLTHPRMALLFLFTILSGGGSIGRGGGFGGGGWQGGGGRSGGGGASGSW